MTDITKGDVDVNAYAMKGLSLRTYHCQGNNEAALRCAERDVHGDLKGKSCLRLEAKTFNDGDLIYVVSWFNEA